jgi:transposase
VAVLDPFRGYARPLRTHLDATVVLDAFHTVRLGFAAVDDVRRRAQQETTGHRGRTHDPLYRARRVLRRAAEKLTDNAWARLLAALEAGDPHGEVEQAWIVAQDLRLGLPRTRSSRRGTAPRRSAHPLRVR